MRTRRQILDTKVLLSFCEQFLCQYDAAIFGLQWIFENEKTHLTAGLKGLFTANANYFSYPFNRLSTLCGC